MDFLSKMSSKTRVKYSIQTPFLCITTFSTTFSTENPRFIHDDLISRKKMIYMKNAEERAWLKTFCQNSWKFTSSLSKSTKTTKKMCKLFTVWFPKELTNVQVFSEFARISPNFRILFENREFVNLFWWFFLQSCLKFKVD